VFIWAFYGAGLVCPRSGKTAALLAAVQKRKEVRRMHPSTGANMTDLTANAVAKGGLSEKLTLVVQPLWLFQRAYCENAIPQTRVASK
jgi:hypothetical protein